MKYIIKLEEMGMFALSIFALNHLQVAWWYYMIMLLGPDIGLVGYLLGNKVGAACYNICHHKGIAVALFLFGFVYNESLVMVAGIIMFGHSSMDRMFGYGLKYNEGFKFTHLGTIGKK
jgi:Domain of unknown function (DUF4260)